MGVVTSLGAAALHDVATSFARRAPHVTLIVYPSLVQGAQAPAELVAAIALAGRRDEVDLLIVCRGGGSLEDLWAFNDEGVVRAIAACPLPVLCGVGHQTDVTLADFAADVRAPTPTAAAELAAPATQDCVDALHAVADAMRQRVLRALDTRRQRLDHVALRLSRPAVALRRRAQRLAMLRQRLDAALRHATAMHAQRERQAAQRLRRAVGVLRRSQALRLAGMASRLEALDPGRVLHRGYAWLTDEQGVALVSASRVLPGQEINAVLADGRVVARVLGVELDPPARR